MGLEIVHIGAVAMDLLADVVPDAVDAVSTIAGLVEHAAARGVDLPRFQEATGRVPLADAGDRGVARPGHNGEDLFIPRGDDVADIPHSGQVAVHRPGAI